jgi:Zn-dependent protease with chaperone function
MPDAAPESGLLARLRRENYLRSWSVASICVLVSVMYFGTELNPFLRDWGLDKIPNYHLATAAAMYALVYVVVAMGQATLTRRRFWHSAPRRIRNALVGRIGTDISRKLGVKPLLFCFGSFDEKKIVASIVNARSVVAIGAGVLPIAALKPAEFEFRLAHEMAHLGARDCQSDRIVSNHYVCCALFLGASLAIALTQYVDTTLALLKFAARPGAITAGRNPVASAVLDALSVITMFAVVMLFLLAERRATLRARELHADGLAASLVCTSFPSEAEISDATARTEFIKVLLRPFVRHPDPSYRASAVATGDPFFSADNIFFVTQSFLLSYCIDLSLQLIGSSAHERAELVAWRLETSPLATVIAFVVAGGFYFLSARLMIGAAALSARNSGTFRASVAVFPVYFACALLGTAFMIGSSQSVWFVLVTSRWRISQVWLNQWDLLVLTFVNIIAVALALSLSGLTAAPSRSRWQPLLAWMPVLAVCLTAATMLFRALHA